MQESRLSELLQESVPGVGIALSETGSNLSRTVVEAGLLDKNLSNDEYVTGAYMQLVYAFKVQ